jgi:hypothetical protein
MNSICYSAVWFDQSQSHDQERMTWIDRYSAPLYIYPRKNAEDPDAGARGLLSRLKE